MITVVPWNNLTEPEREQYSKIQQNLFSLRKVSTEDHQIEGVRVNGNLVGFIADGTVMAKFIYWIPLMGDLNEYRYTSCPKGSYGKATVHYLREFQAFFHYNTHLNAGIEAGELFNIVDTAIKNTFSF